MAMVPRDNSRLNDSFYFENALKEDYTRFTTIYILQTHKTDQLLSEFYVPKKRPISIMNWFLNLSTLYKT